MDLRKAVKMMCLEHGRKQKELAKHLGITEVWLCRLLKKPDNTPLSRIVEMSEFFGVSVSVFVEAGE